MKTNLIKTTTLLLMAAFIGIQTAGAQGTITKPNKPAPKPRTNTNTSTTRPTPRTNTSTNSGTRRDAMSGVTITKIEIGNVTYNGEMLTYYGNTLYENDMKYAKPRLTYNCTRAASDVTLYTKIFRPDGSLVTNSSSPTGYTTTDDADFTTGTAQTLALPGWGSDDGGYYEKGIWRWEIWFNGRKLGSTSFSVYSGGTGVTPSNSSGTSGFEFYGTTRSYTDEAKALSYITTTIKEWGDDGCRTGAISEDERGVAIYGKNGYCYTGACPEGLKKAIKEYNEKEYRISDVTVTDSGWWCVVWNDNGYRGHMPDKMSEMMKQYNNDGETIYSVSICENGNFVIVTDKHWYASHETDNANLQRAYDKFGTIRSCSVTNKGFVACCDRGVYYKDIPTNVETALKEQDFRPKVVKFTDSGTYLITDGDKQRSWYM